MLDLQIWEGAEQYWEAYRVLNRARWRDMGDPLPLRHADIVAYGTAFGFVNDLEELCDIVSSLDQIELGWLAAHRRPEPQPQHPPPG